MPDKNPTPDKEIPVRIVTEQQMLLAGIESVAILCSELNNKLDKIIKEIEENKEELK